MLFGSILQNVLFCVMQKKENQTGWGKFLSDFKFLTLILKAVSLLPNLETFQCLCECLSAFVREKSVTVKERERETRVRSAGDLHFFVVRFDDFREITIPAFKGNLPHTSMACGTEGNRRFIFIFNYISLSGGVTSEPHLILSLLFHT